MHPEVMRSLVSQRNRNLQEEAANRRRLRAARPLKAKTPSIPERLRIFGVGRAAESSPVPNTLPAPATAPEPTPIGITVTRTAIVVNGHDQMERNAS
jgi:hypothetical protein